MWSSLWFSDVSSSTFLPFLWWCLMSSALYRGSSLMMFMIQNEELCSCTTTSKFDVTDTQWCFDLSFLWWCLWFRIRSCVTVVQQPQTFGIAATMPCSRKLQNKCDWSNRYYYRHSAIMHSRFCRCISYHPKSNEKYVSWIFHDHRDLPYIHRRQIAVCAGQLYIIVVLREVLAPCILPLVPCPLCLCVWCIDVSGSATLYVSLYTHMHIHTQHAPYNPAADWLYCNEGLGVGLVWGIRDIFIYL